MSFTIPGIFVTTFSYVRQVAGSYVDGVWTEGTASAAQTAKGAVQPLTPDEVQMLQEGQRQRQSLKIYTETQLNAVDEINKIKGDIVTVEGSEYEVQRVFKQRTPWQHYKCLCTELDA